MITQATITLPRRFSAGWFGVAAIALIYAALYAANGVTPSSSAAMIGRWMCIGFPRCRCDSP